MANLNAILPSLAYLITMVFAQDRNVTVVDTDPSIVYSGQGTGDASICKVDANGNLQGGQAGCYFFPTQCTSSVAMSQNLDGKAGATFKFKGSAIYVNSGLDSISPIFTVTLDETAKDVDGVRPSQGFTCALLFSQTNLDPTVEHTISLSVKGPSPNRNMTVDPDGTALVFSLIDFIYTTSDSTSSSSSSSSSSSNSSSSSTDTGSNSNSSSTDSGASVPASQAGSSNATVPLTTSTTPGASSNTDSPKTNSATHSAVTHSLTSGVLVLASWVVLGLAGFYKG